MKAPKTIQDLIESPRLTGVMTTDEIDEDAVELKAYKKDMLEIEASRYRYFDISDSKLTSLNANNVISFRSTNVRVLYKKSQLTGLQLPEGNFKDVIFENCRINLSNFKNSRFERCLFKDCDLTDADFSMSKLTLVQFDSCQLENTEFSNCVNKRLEFTNCSLSSIKGINGLRGATISNQNLIELAPLLARALDLTIN